MTAAMPYRDRPLERRTALPRGKAPERRKPLARGKPPERRAGLKAGGRLPAESQRTRRNRPHREVVRQRVAERDGYRCRASGLVTEVACRGRLDVHEVIPRSAYPGAQLDERDCILVCRCHHDWIGEHKEQAANLALHGYSWQRNVLGAAVEFIAQARLCNECSDPLGLDFCVAHIAAQAHPECCPFCSAEDDA